PTMIVPFFGDQPFWGSMVAKAGAGAEEPIPYKHLSAERLAEGIKQCLSPKAKISAEKIAKDIELEGDGAKNAVASFHRHLPLQGKRSMRCSIIQDRVAVWELKEAHLLQLSALAAEILVEKKKKLKWNQLRLVRHKEWNDFEGPGEPLTGGGAAIVNSIGGIAKGVGGTPVRWARTVRKREKKEEQRRASATPKTSTDGKSPKSSQPSSRKASQPSVPAPETEAQVSKTQTGEQGAEKYLASGPSLEAEGREQLEKATSQDAASNGHPIHPMFSIDHVTKDDEDVHLDATAESEDNLAQDMAMDAGVGLAQSGEALAKGMLLLITPQLLITLLAVTLAN
ncbi:MAG: hypothetical protein Q9183_007457, partial [Haloplaca sp. 2 TL-2023]